MSEGARESPAVRAGLVAALMAAFLGFVALAAVALYPFYRTFVRSAPFAAPAVFPQPQLQTRSDGLRDPEIAAQQAALERFRWIDRAHGVFQIPIDRAMALVAARGAKAYDPVPVEAAK